MFGESAEGGHPPVCHHAHWLHTRAPAAAVVQQLARDNVRGAVGQAHACGDEEGRRCFAGRHISPLDNARLRGGADLEERRLAVRAQTSARDRWAHAPFSTQFRSL